MNISEIFLKHFDGKINRHYFIYYKYYEICATANHNEEFSDDDFLISIDAKYSKEPPIVISFWFSEIDMIAEKFYFYKTKDPYYWNFRYEDFNEIIKYIKSIPYKKLAEELTENLKDNTDIKTKRIKI